jgi:hypothetical protein
MRQQNQWSETTLFAGLDNSREAEDRGPMKSADALLLNLRLLFSTVGPGGNARSVECPLGAFKPTVGAEKFTFQLQDVPSCPAVFAIIPKPPEPWVYLIR